MHLNTFSSQINQIILSMQHRMNIIKSVLHDISIETGLTFLFQLNYFHVIYELLNILTILGLNQELL